MYLSDQKGMKYYSLHLQMKEQSEGHNPGALGIDGWKGLSKKNLVWMYRAGKLKYEQVSRVHKQLKRADHLEALKYGKVTESELEAAGVFVHSMKSGGGKRKPKEDPSGGRVVQTSIPKTGDWSKSSAEVMQIMKAWEARKAAKAESEARAKKGFEVKPTQQETVELLERHRNKGKCMIK